MMMFDNKKGSSSAAFHHQPVMITNPVRNAIMAWKRESKKNPLDEKIKTYQKHSSKPVKKGCRVDPLDDIP